MYEAGGRYRWGLYGLLILVVLGGIALSLNIARAGREIHAAATPLLREEIPRLSHAAHLESALLRYQLTSNQYFAYSINRDSFNKAERDTMREIETDFAALAAERTASPDLKAIQDGYASMERLGPRLDGVMTTMPVDWDEARAVLVEMNIDTSAMRMHLGRLKEAAESTVYQGGERTGNHVDRIVLLVYLYSLATLASAGVVVYHIRARLRSEARLAHLAAHDALTGLANRRSLEQHLLSLGRTRRYFVLLTIDRFDRVVRGLGHDAGDQLLGRIADRMRQVVADSAGRLYRVDGASFAVVYRCLSDEPCLADLLTALQAAMRAPFDLGSGEIFANLSMGATVYPDHGATPPTLLRNADAALQAARQAGGNGSVIYSDALDIRARERLDLEAQLGHALERAELALHYQPQQNVATGQLVGFEALLRWHRDGAIVSPAEFIPIAEESGLIVPIGEWVLREACAQAKRWNAERCTEFVVAVNISPKQFQHPSFLATVETALSETGADPSHIEFEITEGVVMNGAEETVQTLAALHALGVKLALDDFGTGYSSLSYLKQFPLDKLKIDQSFIRHLRKQSSDAAIVKAVIALGHSLGLVVIAEGVETAEQFDCMQSWLCDEIQGFFYGRPLPAQAATALLAAQCQQPAR